MIPRVVQGNIILFLSFPPFLNISLYLPAYQLNTSHYTYLVYRVFQHTAETMDNKISEESKNKMVYFKLDGRPVKNIDRKALYTRLEARINYLKDFLDFNSSMFPAFGSRLTNSGLMIFLAKQATWKPWPQAPNISRP